MHSTEQQHGLDLERMPESGILWCCGRTELDDQVQNQLRRLCQKNVDWQLLLTAAEMHRLIPLLYMNLKKHCPACVPRDVLQLLTHSFVEGARRSISMTEELLRLNSALKARTINAVFFKGPALAQRYYGDANLRTSSDLDLLVNKNQVRPMMALLEDSGYLPCPWRHQRLPQEFLQSDLFLNLCSEYAFFNGEKKMFVDLHWQVMSTEFFRLPTEDLMERTCECPFEDSIINAFSDVTLLLVLCSHASKHAWSQASWVIDICEVVRNSRIDWEDALSTAEKLGIERMVLLGLYLSKRWQHMILPPLIESKLKTCSQIVACGDEIMERFLSSPLAGQWQELKTWIYFLQLKQTNTQKLSLLLEMCTKPSLDEWIKLPFLQTAPGLYRLVRPGALFLDHFPRAAMRFLKGGYDRRLNVRHKH